jgi:hypothetical protein
MRLYGDVMTSSPYINFGDMRVMRGRQIHLNDSLYIVDQYSDVYVPESTADAMFPADAAFRAWRAQEATDFAAAT